MMPKEELNSLIAAWLDGRLTPEENSRLENKLLKDPAARKRLRSLANLDVSLRDWAVTRALGEAWIGMPPPETKPLLFGFLNTGWHSLPRVMGMLICIALVAGGLALVLRWRTPPVSPAMPPAQLTDLAAVAWPADVAPPAVGAPLGPGPLHLESGTAQVTFGNGAVVALSGPAEMELIAADRARLRYGRAVPYVPERARGFTLLTPQGEIVDLGTEFLVEVASNGSGDIQVINGKVQLAAGRSGGGEVYLPAGYGARVQALSKSSRPAITQVPLLVDEFETADATDLNAGLRQRQSGFAAPIAYLDLDHDAPSILRGGRLALRLESRADRDTPVARVALDHNFAELVGHRYTITFTALLPDRLVGEDNWLALILEDGIGRTSPRVSPAYSREANFAVLLSPRWQAAARVAGKHIYSTRIFQRDRASGPYQVVLQVDETDPHGPRAWLAVNGREVVRDLPVPLGDGRYLGFHSYLSPPHGDESGYVAIDNLRVSVEPGAKSTATGNRAFRATNPQP